MGIQTWANSILYVDLASGPAFAEDLSELLDRAHAATPPDIVLDMGRVAHVVSSNLTQLLQLRKLALASHFKIVIVCVPETLWSVFLTTGLDRLFDFAPDAATALAKLSLTNRD